MTNVTSVVELHPGLCPKNFWDNSCTAHSDCTNLHIRQQGRRLTLFNAAANLDRIKRTIGSTTLQHMRLPTECDFYVVDSQVDPEDFGHPFVFLSSNIFVARAIGLHPSLDAPDAYLNEMHSSLKRLDDIHALAYLGPFGSLVSTSTSLDPPRGPHSALQFAKDFSSKSSARPRATCIESRDEYLLSVLTPDSGPLNTTTGQKPFHIWKTANNVPLSHLKIIMSSLQTSSHQYATFNSDLSTEARELLFQAISQPAGRRCLIESDSTTMDYTSNSDLLPLSVVNTIVDLFIDFSRRPSFKSLGLTLATFNLLFVENGFSCVPLARFTELNLRGFTKLTCCMFSGLYYKHWSQLTYSTPPTAPCIPEVQQDTQAHSSPVLGSPLGTPELADALGIAPNGPQQLWDLFTTLRAERASTPHGDSTLTLTRIASQVVTTSIPVASPASILKRSPGMLHLSGLASTAKATSNSSQTSPPTQQVRVTTGAPQTASSSFFALRPSTLGTPLPLMMSIGHSTYSGGGSQSGDRTKKRVRFEDQENVDPHRPKMANLAFSPCTE